MPSITASISAGIASTTLGTAYMYFVKYVTLAYIWAMQLLGLQPRVQLILGAGIACGMLITVSSYWNLSQSWTGSWDRLWRDLRLVHRGWR